MSGFIAISRKLFDHYLWTKRREFSEAEAWIDLIQSANWQPGRQRIKGQTFDVARGELLAANRYLMERWGWKSLTKVQSFLRTLSEDGMIRSESLSVTSRITICNYETYNSLEVANKSQISRSEVAERSQKGRSEVAEEVKVEQYKQEEKEKQEKQPLAQAGDFDFEKLAKDVGSTCAKLLIEGGVGGMLEEKKRKLLRQWLKYRHAKGYQITTTQELFATIEDFKENTLADIETALKKSYKGGWKIIDIKPEASTEKPIFPNTWQPGIEAKNNYTPEQTLDFHRHLMNLGWYKTTEQGQPYWNRPTQNNSRRTGETSFGAVVKN